jgi:hypothetical protein
MSKTDMPKQYLLTFKDQGTYLHAYVEGESDSYEISKEYWTEIAAECKRRGARNILVEENLLEDGPLVDVFRLGIELPLMGFHARKLAFVDRVPEHLNSNQFGELVTVNRGFDVKMFDTVEAAEKWLLDG